MPSLRDRPVASGNQHTPLVEFRAGKMAVSGNVVHPDKRKGLVSIYQSEDCLMHFCWKDRITGAVEDDLIIFPNDIEFKHVSQCTTGRVYVLKFKSSSRKFFFWLQEPRADKDEENCWKVNDFLNNPAPTSPRGSSGDLRSDLPSLGEQNLQSILGRMNQQQLMQLLTVGMGMGVGSPVSELSGSLLNRSTSVQSYFSELPLFPQPSVTRAAPVEAAFASPCPAVSSSTLSTQRPAGSEIRDSTSYGDEPASVSADSRKGSAHTQLSDLQNSFSEMRVDLGKVLEPEAIIPILANPEVRTRLTQFLPDSTLLPKTEDELHQSIDSPHFQQVLTSFSAALQSGQLAPLMSQFSLGEDVVNAATHGDMEAFIRAMQETTKKRAEDEDDFMKHWLDSSPLNNQGDERDGVEQLPGKDVLIEQILFLLHNSDSHELFSHGIYSSCFDSVVPNALERVYVAGAKDALPQFSSTDEFIEILQQVVEVKRTTGSSSSVGEMDNSAFFCVSTDEKMRCSSPFITAPEAFEWTPITGEIHAGTIREEDEVNYLGLPKVESEDQHGRTKVSEEDEIKSLDFKYVCCDTGSHTSPQQKSKETCERPGEISIKDEDHVLDECMIQTEDSLKSLNVKSHSEVVHPYLTSYCTHTCLPQDIKKVGKGHAHIARRVDGKVTYDSFRSSAEDEAKTLGLNCLSRISNPELTSLGQDYLQQTFTGTPSGHNEAASNIECEPKSLTDLIAYYNSKCVNVTQLHDVTRQLNGRQNEKGENSVIVKCNYGNVRYGRSNQSSMMANTHSHSTRDIIEEESEQRKDMAGLNNARDFKADENVFLQASEICLPVHQEDAINDREDMYLLAFESPVDVDYPVERFESSVDVNDSPVEKFESPVDVNDYLLEKFESPIDVNDSFVESTERDHVNPDQIILVHEIDSCIDNLRVIPPEFDSSVDERESSLDSLKENRKICFFESSVDNIDYNMGNQVEETIYSDLEHMADIKYGRNSRQQKEGYVKSSKEECAQDYTQTELTLSAKKGPVGTSDSSINGHMGSIVDMVESPRNIDGIEHNSVYINNCCMAANVVSVILALGSDLESNTCTQDVNGFVDTVACDMKNMVNVTDITMQNRSVTDTHECKMENNFVESNKCSVERNERQSSEMYICVLNSPLYLNEYTSEISQLEQCVPAMEVSVEHSAEGAVIEDHEVTAERTSREGHEVTVERTSREGHEVTAERTSREGHEVMAERISKEDHQAMIGGAIIKDSDLMEGVNYEGDYKATVEHFKISAINIHPLNMQAKEEIRNSCSVVEPRLNQLNQLQFDKAAPDYTEEWYEAHKKLITEHQVLNSCNLDKRVNLEHLMQESCNMDRSKVSDEHQIIDSCNLVSNRVENGKSKCKIANEIDNCDVVKGQVICQVIENNHSFSESYMLGGIGSLKEMSYSQQEDCDTEINGQISDRRHDVSCQCCNISDVPGYDEKLQTNMCQKKKIDHFCAGNKITWQISSSVDGELLSENSSSGSIDKQQKLASRSCSEICAEKTDSYACNVPMALTNEVTGHINNVNVDIDNKKELDIELSEEISFPSTSILCDNEIEDASGDVTEDINGDCRPVWSSIIGFDHLSSDISCASNSATGAVKTGLAVGSDTEPGRYQFMTVGAGETDLESDEISHVNSLHIVIGGKDGELRLPSPLFKAFEREVGSVYSKYLTVNKMLHRSEGSCTQDNVSDCRCVSEPTAELDFMTAGSEEKGLADRLCLRNQGKHNYTCSTGKMVVKCSSLNSLQRIFDSHPSFECEEIKELTFQTQIDGQDCFWKTTRNQTECKEEQFNVEKVQLEQLLGTDVQIRENEETRNDRLFAKLDKNVRRESVATLSGIKKLGSSPILLIKEPASAILASPRDVPRTSSFKTDKTIKWRSEHLQQEDYKSGIQFAQFDSIMELGRNSEQCWDCVVPSLDEGPILDLAKIDTEDYQSEMPELSTGMCCITPEQAQGYVGSVPCPVFGRIPDLEHEHLLQNTACNGHVSSEDNQTAVSSSINVEVMPQKVNAALQKAKSSADTDCNSINRKFYIAVQTMTASAEIGRNSVYRKTAGMTEKERAEYLYACRCPGKISLTSLRKKTTTCREVVETLQIETDVQKEERSFLSTLFWICLAVAILIFDIL